MTIEELRKRKLILLECISGSRAYGLATPESDTDIRGVFLLPKKDFYGLKYIPQLSNATNDVVFYELGRFLELLSVNNPNILELLNTPADCILHKSPLLDRIDPSRILSRKCKATFGKFALSQMKKARGLNKKIVNPMERQRKTPLDFCYVSDRSGSIPLTRFLAHQGWRQDNCGLVNIPHMKDIFGLYHSDTLDYAGILKHDHSNELALSSIPKGEEQRGLLYFNRDGYSAYCKAYREYWAWVDKRNEVRYESTKSHGRNYDAKNMMHTFRLLHMAIEIAEQKRILVRRPDRDFLLRVKSGAFGYGELLQMAKEKQRRMERAFEASDLPAEPDGEYIEELAYELRKAYY